MAAERLDIHVGVRRLCVATRQVGDNCGYGNRLKGESVRPLRVATVTPSGLDGQG